MDRGGTPNNEPMKVALLARLKRLEQLRPADSRLPEFQIGYLEKLAPDYAGDRHIVTVGRDPDGLYHWKERRGPEPDEGQGNLPPFRVVLAPPEDVPPAPGVAEIDRDIAEDFNLGGRGHRSLLKESGASIRGR
jgi:hypothetical protein